MKRWLDEYKDRYLRFKADEASQALTGAYRQAHPEDNNERQAVHEHVSVALDAKPAAKHADCDGSRETAESFGRCGTMSVSTT